MKIAIDWSHTKELTTYDGHKLRCEDKASLLKRLKADGESIDKLKSSRGIQPSAVVLEQGCPLSLVYDILQTNAEVKLISNRATQDYRVEHNIEKTDENDAKLIYELSNNGATLMPITLNDTDMLLHNSYHQYCRFQKARIAMMNMRKAHLRHFGDANLAPYDTAIDSLKAKEKALQKVIDTALNGGKSESNTGVKSKSSFQLPPPIKGLGNRLWGGIMVTANPANFACLSAYLRFCGLTADATESHRYNRHARMLYHLLAEEIVKHRDATFRPLYDKFKADMAIKYEGEPKYRVNNAAMNRTATFLAKAIYRYCCNGANGDGESMYLVQSKSKLQPSPLTNIRHSTDGEGESNGQIQSSDVFQPSLSVDATGDGGGESTMGIQSRWLFQPPPPKGMHP